MNNFDIVLGIHNENDYYVHSLVTLHSVLSRSHGIRAHIFHDDTLDQSAQEKFMKIGEHFESPIIFHNLTAQVISFQGMSALKNFSLGCMFCLMIPNELPDRRVLYLDSDIIANTDIRKVFLPLPENETKPLLAVRDSFACKEIFAKHLQKLGLSPETYFNSGVLFFSCELFNSSLPHFLDDAIRLAHEDSELLFPDQDILNLLVGKKGLAGIMTSKANFQMGDHNRSFLDPQKLKDKIIHYTWRKPWEVIYPASMLYWREREKLVPILE